MKRRSMDRITCSACHRLERMWMWPEAWCGCNGWLMMDQGILGEPLLYAGSTIAAWIPRTCTFSAVFSFIPRFRFSTVIRSIETLGLLFCSWFRGTNSLFLSYFLIVFRVYRWIRILYHHTFRLAHIITPIVFSTSRISLLFFVVAFS